MPIIFSDNHHCEKCGKLFEWSYFELIRQNINSPSPQLMVESMPHDKVLAHNCQHRDNGTYDIEVNCPHCDYDNYFKFIKN